MTRFLALCSAILFSTLSAALLTAPSASAQALDQYPFFTSQGVYYRQPGGKLEDHTADWRDFFWDSFKRRNPSNFASLKASFDAALQNGAFGVVRRDGVGDAGLPYDIYYIFWTEKSDCDFHITRSGGPVYTLYNLQSRKYSDSGCKIHSVAMDIFPRGGSSSYSFTLSSRSAYRGADTYLRLFLFTGDFTVQEGIDKDKLNISKGADGSPFIPLFWYKVEKMNFFGVYNGLGHKLGDSAQATKPDLDPHNWLWKVYAADDNFEKQGEPLFSYKTAGFNYDFTSYGNYIITVEYDLHPPRVAPENVKPLKFEFKLKVDGSTYSSSSYEACDGAGICAPLEEQACELYKDVAGRIQCRMRKTFNFGVFGPSLNAMNRLFNSFIVKQPMCSIPLADAVVAGRTISFTSLQSEVCRRSEQLRHTFPVVPLLINFALAALVLSMIIGVVNRLTNPRDNNIVEAP